MIRRFTTTLLAQKGGRGRKGRKMHLGNFNDEPQAAKAYDKVAREDQGRFARVNFPNLEREG